MPVRVLRVVGGSQQTADAAAAFPDCQLEDPSLSVLEVAAQLVGSFAAGSQLVGDMASERLGESLLERAQLLA
jgi:hypothetical protein